MGAILLPSKEHLSGTYTMKKLTHVDDTGRANMVDVGAKPETHREAIAVGSVAMDPETLAQILANATAKGDVLGVARIAGIMAAKRTGEWIPLCHPLSLDFVGIEFAAVQPPQESRLWIRATARCYGRTGVEMEAMTALSAAALTLYDMSKAIDRGMRLGPMFLWKKSGGKSGTFFHPHAETLGPPADISWR